LQVGNFNQLIFIYSYWGYWPPMQGSEDIENSFTRCIADL